MSDPTVKDAGWLQIYVYNDKNEFVWLAANTLEPHAGMTYVPAAGRFYLKISPGNCKWKVAYKTALKSSAER
jgi:hypothetical protein